MTVTEGSKETLQLSAETASHSESSDSIIDQHIVTTDNE